MTIIFEQGGNFQMSAKNHRYIFRKVYYCATMSTQMLLSWKPRLWLSTSPLEYCATIHHHYHRSLHHLGDSDVACFCGNIATIPKSLYITTTCRQCSSKAAIWQHTTQPPSRHPFSLIVISIVLSYPPYTALFVVGRWCWHLISK